MERSSAITSNLIRLSILFFDGHATARSQRLFPHPVVSSTMNQAQYSTHAAKVTKASDAVVHCIELPHAPLTPGRPPPPHSESHHLPAPINMHFSVVYSNCAPEIYGGGVNTSATRHWFSHERAEDRSVASTSNEALVWSAFLIGFNPDSTGLNFSGQPLSYHLL